MFPMCVLLVIVVFVVILIVFVCICTRIWLFLHQKHKKSIAVCISGCIRSFPRASYRKGLKRLLTVFPNADFFLVLKRNDVPHTKHPPLFLNKAGVDGFMKTMDIIQHNTKSVMLFDGFVDEHVNNRSFHASQVRMMDTCFNTASKHKDYDFYLRYRPDFVLLDAQLPKDPYTVIDENTIYTTRKDDAIGSDQVFLFSKKLKKEWWDEYVIPTAEKFILAKKIIYPEFFIFEERNPSTIKNGPLFFGGLLRTNENKLMLWDERKNENTVIDDWKPMTVDIKNGDDNQLLTNALRNRKYVVKYQRNI